MTKLFQYFGVPETVTSDGSPQFISNMFQTFLKQYGVHHRLQSVAFSHANARVELAVKDAKKLPQENMSSDGKLDNLAVTRSLLTYRNTPDRDTRLSPTFMLLGRNLRNFLPTRPPLNSANDLCST